MSGGKGGKVEICKSHPSQSSGIMFPAPVFTFPSGCTESRRRSTSLPAPSWSPNPRVIEPAGHPLFIDFATVNILFTVLHTYRTYNTLQYNYTYRLGIILGWDSTVCGYIILWTRHYTTCEKKKKQARQDKDAARLH